MRNTKSEIVPFAYGEIEVRTINVDGEPYLVARDVCNVLDIKDTHSAVRNLDDDEYLLRTVSGSAQNRTVLLVNESGLYHLIFKSRKPEAKAFRKWVTAEVLPQIRRTGSYAGPGGQLALWQPETTPMLEDLRYQMMDVAMSTRSTKVRGLLRTLRPLVFPNPRSHA